MKKTMIKLLAASLLAAGFGSALAQNEATGAGASFPAPLYARWAADYNKLTGVKINYQSVGSGAGLKQIEAKTVDFGASDAPLKAEALAAKGLLQFPTVVGGVVPVINVQGIKPGELKLTGAILADIYLGKITKWNDPAIAAHNSSVKLPDATIAPVRRADGSGTSYIFTSYLSKVSPEWKDKVGEGTAVNWPIGAGGKGNEGVAAFVGRLPNSIGYVESAYVKQNKLNFVQLKNADGNFVLPTDETVKAAAAGAKWDASFYENLTNQPGAQAWPIANATYILLQKNQDKPEQAAAVLKFFDWAYKNGDASASALDYVPMPSAVKQAVNQSWSQIKTSSGQPLPLN